MRPLVCVHVLGPRAALAEPRENTRALLPLTPDVLHRLRLCEAHDRLAVS